jgi:hypothetical protein
LLLTSHSSQCQKDPMCDKARRGQIWLNFGAKCAFLSILALTASSHRNSSLNSIKKFFLRLLKCRNFHLVTVTSHLCQSVKLIKMVQQYQMSAILPKNLNAQV